MRGRHVDKVGAVLSKKSASDYDELCLVGACPTVAMADGSTSVLRQRRNESASDEATAARSDSDRETALKG